MFYLTKFNSVRLLTKHGAMIWKNINTCNGTLFKRNGLIQNFTKLKFSQIRGRPVFGLPSKETLEKLKEKDNVPDAFQLIYRNSMSLYLLGAQIVSSVGAGLVGLSWLVYDQKQNFGIQGEQLNEQLNVYSVESYIVFATFIGLCALIQLLIARLPLRVYNYPKQREYIMISYGALPTTTKRLTCTISEITKQPTGILPWTGSTYEIKNKGKVILMENSFRTPADLNILSGYQRESQDEDM